MKKFYIKIVLFFIPVILFIGICIGLPPTPKVAGNLLFAEIKKDSLLKHVKAPRLIFVGGSNLSFGLDSHMISQNLNAHPINTGLFAGLGLPFMMNNTLSYVKEGDIVVLVPEYQHFYNGFFKGQDELLRLVLEVDIMNARHLNFQQWRNLLEYVPVYTLTKFDSDEYIAPAENLMYSVNSFNEYGDADKHWKSPPEQYGAYGSLGEDFDEEVIEAMESFRDAIDAKGAKLIVSFPGYQVTSFNLSFSEIKNLERIYKEKFNVMGTPERYAVPDSLTLNTPYHLIKEGVDHRTRLVIHDLLLTFPELHLNAVQAGS